jgi:hypothetical protein
MSNGLYTQNFQLRSPPEEGYSAGNYQLTDKESTGGMVILSVIISSWTLIQPVKDQNV